MFAKSLVDLARFGMDAGSGYWHPNGRVRELKRTARDRKRVSITATGRVACGKFATKGV